MVKASDLGYPSKNLQDLPSKEDKKDQAMQLALFNLTKMDTPERLSSAELPNSLHNLTGE